MVSYKRKVRKNKSKSSYKIKMTNKRRGSYKRRMTNKRRSYKRRSQKGGSARGGSAGGGSMTMRGAELLKHQKAEMDRLRGVQQNPKIAKMAKNTKRAKALNQPRLAAASASAEQLRLNQLGVRSVRSSKGGKPDKYGRKTVGGSGGILMMKQ